MEKKFLENWKFDADSYVKEQRDAILVRLEKFGRLYLEIEWETVKNVEASELIPGFPVDANKMIFQELKDKIEILFCINADDILKDTEFTMQDVPFAEYLETRLIKFHVNLSRKIRHTRNNFITFQLLQSSTTQRPIKNVRMNF